jgi:transcriptional regulator with XRE-family HTH domain
MATRERQVHRGRAKGLRLMREFAQEFRAARRSTGLSQEAVARASDISRATIGRLELGRLTHLSIVRAAELAAVVGLDLSLRAYPDLTPVREAGQLRLLERMRLRLGPAWIWRYEVLLGISGDRRAWDAQVRHTGTGVVIVIEAVSRLTDVQEVLRRIARKRLDGQAARVVLLLAETRTNAEVTSSTDSLLRSAFPVSSRAALRALAEGRDPGADAIVVL